MEDLLYYTCLFDYYKDLFTKTKQDYFIDYYFNNLTQEEIAENYKDRVGGYTQIIKMGSRRGDNAEKVILKLV